MTHKALYDTNWPNYLALHPHGTVNAYNLRSLAAPRLEIPKEVGTFQDCAARSFNDLSDFIRCVSDYDQFIKLVKTFYFNNNGFTYIQVYCMFTDNLD